MLLPIIPYIALIPITTIGLNNIAIEAIEVIVSKSTNLESNTRAPKGYYALALYTNYL